MPRMTGGEALVKMLIRQGIDTVFGLPGVQMYGVIAALRDEQGIRMITTRSEGSTTHMADGYARVGNRIGAALVVPGPGVYNAAGGLSTAFAVSSPVLLIAGQIPRETIGKNLGELHEVNDQIDAIKPITKWQTRVTTAPAIPGAVHEAFKQLRTGRPRPVHIDIPPEAMLELADLDLPEPTPQKRSAPSEDLLARAAKEIRLAKFPLIFAGGGIHLSQAHDELAQFAESNHLPVMTSRGGKGAFPDSHPLLYGTLTARSTKLDEIYRNSDLVIAIGTRLSISGPTQQARVIHIDVDPYEIGKFHENTLALEGDAKITISNLQTALSKVMMPNTPVLTNMVSEAKEGLNSSSERREPQDSYMKAIRGALPEDGIAVYGMTQLGYYSRSFWRTEKPRTFIDSGYSGNLGFSYPTAIGAKVARPNLPVICISGDGGFGYHSAEMSTAVKYGIGVVTVLFNDGAYGNVARDMDETFDGSYEADLANPDYMKLAEAYGVTGYRVQDISALKNTILDAVQADQPALIEVPVGRMPKPASPNTRPMWAIPAMRR